MLSIIINNYILIVLLIGFIVLLSNSLKNNVNKKRDRIRELLVVIIILVISSAFRTYFLGLDHYTVGSIITYYICYILRPPVIIIFTALLTEKKYIKYLSLLCLINTLIYTIGLFNGMTFSFTAYNELVRGPFCYTAHVLCVFYFLVLLSVVVKQYNRHNIIRTILLLSFMVVCSFASLIDINSKEIYLFDTAILICGFEYYLYLYMEHNKIDVLTNAYNRATFYSDIKRLGNKVTSVISIDMNDLKKINDNEGHDEGDKAIFTIANVLLNVDSNNVRIYRVGGDEFVGLCFYKERELVKDYVKNAKKELNKTKYHCSFGFAYKDIDDIYEVYKYADNKMYKDKEAYHKKYGRYR